jgi:hypothetical protein
MFDRVARRESVALIAAIVVLQVAYLIGCALGPSRYFGVNQLHGLGLPGCSVLLVGTWIVAGLAAMRMPASPEQGERQTGTHPIVEAALVALVGACAFLLLRSHVLNPDGTALLEKIPRDVADHGAHVTHDEMLELYLHSRAYFYAKQSLGWSVRQTYQVLSALAGGVFLLLLCLFSRVIAPLRVQVCKDTRRRLQWSPRSMARPQGPVRPAGLLES